MGEWLRDTAALSPKKVRFRRTLANVLAMVGRKEVAAVVGLWPNKESGVGAGGGCAGW